MNKKYFSTGEFFTVNQNYEKEPYTGYVTIKNGTAYKYGTEIALLSGNSFSTAINLSNEFFDRNLAHKLKLPHDLSDCTFAANDYLKRSVLTKIIKNLDENNRYIYKNCLVSRNDLPVADIIPVLSPWREVSNTKKDDITVPTTGEVTGWAWSNISYNFINNISEKDNWPDTVWGQDWDTNEIVDSDFVITDKVDGQNRQLYAVFIAEKTQIRLFNLYLFPDDKLNIYSDPIVDLVKDNNTGKITEEVSNRTFDTSNFDVKTFSNVDPQNSSSFKFKEIAGIKISGNYLYVVDKGLNGIFKYDISNCILNRKGKFKNLILLDNESYGLGDLNTPYLFNQPTAIAANENTVAVLDTGNLCVKLFDTDFNHISTIRQGAFVRQNPQYVQICPYSFKLDEQIIDSGAIFIISESSKKISIDVYKKDGTYIKNKQIKYLSLEPFEFASEAITGNYIISANERIKKVEFSANDSNLYYIVTSRRIIKLYLSDLVEPIGISSLIRKIAAGETTYGILWNEMTDSVDGAWGTAKLTSGAALIWGEKQNTYPLSYPYNHCFSIGWNPEINSDIIFTISGNIIYYDAGTTHRFDNLTDKKKLYYTADGTLTYDKSDGDYYNKPVIVKINSIVPEYKANSANKPVATNNLIKYEIKETLRNRVYNTILFYKEPNTYKSLLMHTDLSLYSLNETLGIIDEEYVSQVSLNKLLYKILFNLNEIRQYLYGTFTAGYSAENIMTYNSIDIDYSIATDTISAENFMFGENERISIVLNRCFENIYKIQAKVIDKIQTKFVSSSNYNLHSFKSI